MVNFVNSKEDNSEIVQGNLFNKTTTSHNIKHSKMYLKANIPEHIVTYRYTR